MTDTNPAPGRPAKPWYDGTVPGPNTVTKGFVHVEMVEEPEGAADDDPEREWSLGALLTVASGGIVLGSVREGVDELNALVRHLTGKTNVYTTHLPDGCDVARDHVREHMACWPEVAHLLGSALAPQGTPPTPAQEEALSDWVRAAEQRGHRHAVPPMPECDWVPGDPVAYIVERQGKRSQS